MSLLNLVFLLFLSPQGVPVAVHHGYGVTGDMVGGQRHPVADSIGRDRYPPGTMTVAICGIQGC